MSREKTAKKRSAPALVLEVVVIVAAAFVIALLVQFFLVKPFTIHQLSMEPTLLDGDRILISRVTYHFREPRSGDVVVFRSPVNRHEDLVKRVVAVGGEAVEIKDGRLYVDGREQEEPYVKRSPFSGPDRSFAVPEGSVFVLGDNRDHSGDSRLFGPVELDAIIGKAFGIYWPLGRWGGV